MATEQPPPLEPQVRIGLRNWGLIDPEDIGDYIASGGYSGLKRALSMTPEAVIDEISQSGLRGRGGAGFPTAGKWRLTRDASGEEKCVVCNAHGWDEETSIGRELMENDPHSVLEGLLIGAYGIGAHHGYVYINHEFKQAVARSRHALEQMANNQLLGDSILGSGFGFHLEVWEGARDFICGEETAMIRSMEGRRATPCACPPYPASLRLRGQPTSVNSAETWASVSAILENGAEWFCGYGTAESRGTKIFSLTGQIGRPGLIEVPFGTTLRQIVEVIGEGVAGGRALKAVRLGGPLGGYLPADDLDLVLDYEHVRQAGTTFGSGNIFVLAADACAVDQARRAASFGRAESCGFCVLCREGTVQMLEMLTDVAEGRGRPEDLELLLALGEGMKMASLCDLGRTAPDGVISTILNFREEFERHLGGGTCPTGICATVATASD